MKVAGAALTVAALTLLAACSSSKNNAAGSGTPTGVSTSPTPTPTLVPTLPTVSLSSSSPRASSDLPTSASVTHSASPSPTPTQTVPQTTCTSLSVRVLPGGASPGQEIAAIQFTNTGNTRCVVAGYPVVTLLRKGKRIGKPSEPSTTAVSSRTLRPGAVAESLLHDYTQTCQAPLSDSVRVRLPGTDINYLRPQMQLRACVLRVDRLGAPE